MGVVLATLLLGVIICANGHNCNHASGEHDFLERAISPQVNTVVYTVQCILYGCYRTQPTPVHTFAHIFPT